MISATPNARRLLCAGSMAILAAGVGFGIRGGILASWGLEFRFTGAQLGAIGGAGFSGFCFGIILGGLICDKVGYGKLVLLAFILHLLSAAVTVTATGAAAYQALYWGMFIFAYANGTLEAVANPLVATLFPNDRTHFLNILHSSWPAGLVLGGAVGWILGDELRLDWRIQLSLYLIPTLVYGFLFFGQRMPRSPITLEGLTLGQMLCDVGISGALVVCYLLALFGQDALRLPPSLAYGFAALLLFTVAFVTRFSAGSFLLFILFVAHALLGAVELGTDGWIQNITGNILTSAQGKILFILTSATMFGLRFCAGFVERRLGLSPVEILFCCAVLACLGLNLTSKMATFAGAALALVIYAAGKTFMWPTMLAVASDRFPRTGALAISIMGGIGMMSAGLIGTPGLGYAKDRFSAQVLEERSAALYTEYRAATPSRFLFFKEVRGLDLTKIEDGRAPRVVYEASVAGDRRTLKTDALIPAALAVIFLGLLVGSKRVRPDAEST